MIEDVEYQRLCKAATDASEAVRKFEKTLGYADVMATVAALEVFIKVYPEPKMSELLDLITTHRNLRITLQGEFLDRGQISVCIMHYVGHGGSGSHYQGNTFVEAAQKAIEGARESLKMASTG